ncbi:hypothetical protein [Streptomyces sp. CRN 30]|nr:hypothetical protein [Streptomyces sp. CRN 30]
MSDFGSSTPGSVAGMRTEGPLLGTLADRVRRRPLVRRLGEHRFAAYGSW